MSMFSDMDQQEPRRQQIADPLHAGNETPGRVFMASLLESERLKDPSLVARLFRRGATLERMSNERQHHRDPQPAAADFWRTYLASFDEIRSSFRNVIETSDSAVLEWVSEGTLKTGTSFRYEGVSILDLASDGAITGFRTYYDSAAFVNVSATSPMNS